MPRFENDPVDVQVDSTAPAVRAVTVNTPQAGPAVQGISDAVGCWGESNTWMGVFGFLIYPLGRLFKGQNMKTFSVFLASMALSGCAWFTPPMANPTNEAHATPKLGHVNMFSMIPSRRMVIVGNDSSGNEPNGDRAVICAEASADVTDNLISTLSASLSASGSVASKGSGELSAGISQALATAAQFLYKRTQGVQLYRDSMYHLCQARMNGYIDNVEYKDKSKALLEASVALITLEIPRLQPIVNSDAKLVVPATSNANANTGKTNVSISDTGADRKSAAQPPSGTTETTAPVAQPK